MDVYALDKQFNVITVGIPYTNMQWNRRYYEAGDFQMEVTADVYDPSWAYIGTNDRPELGMVQQVQTIDEGDVSVLVGGFFCEKMLDDKVVYPRYIADISKTEQAVRLIFDKYKEDLPIGLGPINDPLLGDRTRSDFSDDYLGDKIYRILETRELSYRVVYDYVNNNLQFSVWKGVDRTQSQDVNPFQTFSTEFGNILSKSIDLDDSDYKNYAIVPVDADDNGKERTHYVLDYSDGGYKRKMVVDLRASKPEGGQSEEDFKASCLQEARERLLTHAKVENIDIDVADMGAYMVDFDLGDRCDVLLNDVDITMESRIVEVMEVFKADTGHTVTVGLGNRRISNIRRATS